LACNSTRGFTSVEAEAELDPAAQVPLSVTSSPDRVRTESMAIGSVLCRPHKHRRVSESQAGKRSVTECQRANPPSHQTQRRLTKTLGAPPKRSNSTATLSVRTRSGSAAEGPLLLSASTSQLACVLLRRAECVPFVGLADRIAFNRSWICRPLLFSLRSESSRVCV
jgi:hypothetical protein